MAAENPDRVLDKPRKGIKYTRPGYLEFRFPSTWLARYSAGERGVSAADRGDPALGLLPVLLAAQGGQVEEGVGVPDILDRKSTRLNSSHSLSSRMPSSA